MSKNVINEISSLIEKTFHWNNRVFEEKDEKMSISVKTDGCKCVIFSFDRKLGKEYKGGLFPFFVKKEGVNSVNDYMVFAERSGRLYCLLIELKKGNQHTFPQLRAGHELAKFIINTLNRVKKSNYNPEYRFISIKDVLILKKHTKPEAVKYDAMSHHVMRSPNFNLKSYLV